MWVRLGDDDRARLKCPEWMRVDVDDVSVRDYRVVQRATGLKPVDVVDAFDRRDADGFAAYAWFACRLAGVDAGPFDAFDFALGQASFRSRHPDEPEPAAEPAEDVAEAPGKDDPTPA